MESNIMLPEKMDALLDRLGLGCVPGVSATPFLSEETGEPYQVFDIHAGQDRYVLKLAKSGEAQIYRTFLSHAPAYAPRLLASTEDGTDTWLLLEYVSGSPMMDPTRAQLTAVLDGLICMQREFWGADPAEQGIDYPGHLDFRRKRREYLEDPVLTAAYDLFLEMFQSVPKTLCHDDLLPFNVLVGPQRAVLIDWEAADILAYPTSLARLTAHGTQQPGDLFRLSEEDRVFALDYYYRNLAGPMGISPTEYRKNMELAYFYEYCEWIYVGNRYDERQSNYYQRYLPMARALGERLLRDAG